MTTCIMRIRRDSVFMLLTFTVAAGQLHAEPPPRSKDDLQKWATLIVTGTVTAVKVNPARAFENETQYYYDLTVLVETVTKGKFEVGTALKARGEYIELVPGVTGGTGHRADNSGVQMTAIEPGWELKLHLAGPDDGVYWILSPNGFAVISGSASPVPGSFWYWIAAAGVILSAALLMRSLAGRRRAKRIEPGAAPGDGK